MIERADIVAEARAWLKTPYMHQQRMKGIGVDCAGLVIGVARNLGMVAADFDVNGYSRQPDGFSLMAHCERWMRRIDRDEMQLGDVIVTRYDADPNHFGILADYLHGGLSVIHALGTRDGRGHVLEHRLDAGTLARFVAAFKLPGVA
jgi:cell wall-associated NlpC family hydrolase